MSQHRIEAQQARIRALCGEVERLKDQIANMEEALLAAMDPWMIGDLTRKEALVLGLLVKKGRASKAAIHQWLYSADPGDGADPKIVEVFVCNLRKKLPPGVEIRTLWGEGYELPPAGRHILERKVA